MELKSPLSVLEGTIRDVKAFPRHKQQDEYDKLLFGEYLFTLKMLASLLPEGGKVLDVGTAYGTVAVAAKRMGYEVKATDMTKEYLAKTFLKENKVPFSINDIENEELPYEDMDAVIFTEVLEHLNTNPSKALKHLKGAMKKGGYLIVTTPAFENQGSAPGRHAALTWWRQIPGSVPDWRDEHTRHYSRLELVDMFVDVGLEVEDIGYCYDGMSHFIVGRKP